MNFREAWRLHRSFTRRGHEEARLGAGGADARPRPWLQLHLPHLRAAQPARPGCGLTMQMERHGQHRPRAPEHLPAEPHQDLQVCLACWSGLVFPVQWEESGPENWSVLLRCPNCDTYREGIFAQRTVDAFDDALNRGADTLAREYRRLMRANMTEEIERFVAALEADAILPEDF